MKTFFSILITFAIFVQNMGFSLDIKQYKSCQTCKWFIPNEKSTDYGLCKLFKERLYIVDKERLICNFAKHCRNNELLCGKEGNFYEDNLISYSESNIEKKLKDFDERYENLIEKIDESNDIGNGEITEKYELDSLNQLDKEVENFTKEGLELLFKVKKFNKRKISIALDKFCKHDRRY